MSITAGIITVHQQRRFLCKLQPIQLVNYTLEIAKPGKLPGGKTEIPFEIPLKPKVHKQLYETYHGVFVNIQVSVKGVVL